MTPPPIVSPTAGLLARLFFIAFVPFLISSTSNAQSCCSTAPVSQFSFLANADVEMVDRYFDADVFVWPNGDLIGGHGFWVGLNDFCESKLMTRVSTDGGMTWAPPGSTVFDKTHPAFVPASPTQETYGLHSPSFLKSADGTKLHVFFLVKSRNVTCNTAVTCPTFATTGCTPFENRVFRSEISLSGTYNAANWSAPVEVTSTIPGYNIMNNARAIRLSNGTIALAVTVSQTINSSLTTTNFRSYVAYSADEGLTWSRTGEVSVTNSQANGGLDRGFMEPEIVEINNGGVQKILMVMRVNNPNPRYNTIPINSLSGPWDFANGSANIPLFPPAGSFPNVANNSPVSLERIPCSGDLLLIFNEETNAQSNSRSRNKLMSMISTDEGQTWGQKRDLEVYPNSPAPIIDNSYVSITMEGDKALLTYYQKGVSGKYSTGFRAKSISEFYDPAQVATICPCLNPPADMVGWWSGDANANDIQGSYNGVLTNGALAGSAGKVSGAFRLDGINDYVAINSPVVNTAPYTVDAWVNPNSTGPLNKYIVANGGETGAGYGFALSIVNGNWRFTVRTAAGEVGIAEVAIASSSWTFLAGTWDGSLTAGSVKLYVDGVLATSATPTTGNASGTAKNLFIGRPTLVTNYLWNGLIDEVEVFDRVLTASEILGLFDADSKGKCKQKCVDPPADMVGWWPGDVNANDIKGSNNGTLVFGAQAGTSGNVSGAFSFDGINDYVAIGNPVVNTAPYSVDAWVNPNSTGPLNKYIVSNGGETGGSYGLALSIVSGKWRFTVRSSTGDYGFAEFPIANTDWTFLAGTWDGSLNSGSIKLYVDGVLAANGTPTAGNPFGPPSNLYIGRPSPVINYLWNGSIDEVELFSRVLSANEVQGLFNAGSYGKCKPLIAHSDDQIGRLYVDEPQPDEQLLSVFPNPNIGQFTLVSSLESGQVTISNVLGKTVWSGQVAGSNNSIEIDLAPYGSGMYFVRLQNGSTVETVSVIVQ